MKKFFFPIITIPIIAVFILLTSDLEAQNYRILPLGNSITDGTYDNVNPPVGDRISYRKELYDQLTDGGYSFDFVGHASSGYNLLEDANHGGIPGSRAQYVVRLLQDGYDERWDVQITPDGKPYLDEYPADIILLHIGTNDITHDEGSNASDVEDILDEIDAWEASSGTHVVVFVARIIKRTDNTADSIATIQFNDNVESMVSGRADPSIIMVDMETGAGIDYATELLSDGIHPAQSALDKMGQQWYAALNAYLSTLPDPPSGLALDGETNSTIDLVWNDHSSNETGFQIERSLTSSGGDFTWIYTTSDDVTSYTSNGLASNTHYFFRVRAINDNGPSLYTSVESTYTLPDPPAAPTGLSATAVDEGTIDLTWSDTNNENNYTIEKSMSSGSGFTDLITLSANTTYYRDEGLTDGTEYFYRIYATNPGGNSDYSTEASARTDLAIPSSLSATASGTSSISLAWTDNSDTETGYMIERSATSGSGFTFLTSVTEGLTGYTDNSVLDGSTYYYRVRAEQDGLYSDYSNEASATTNIAAPSGLSATASGSSSIILAWTDNSYTETGYSIERSFTSGTGFSELTSVGAGSEGHTDNTVSDNTTYYYRVRAVQNSIFSGYSNEASATTELAIPGPPSGLKGNATSTCTVELTWKDNSDNEDGFVIRRATLLSGPYDSINSVTSDVKSYTDTETENYQTYYYRVNAYNTAGSSSYTSATVIVNIILKGGTIGPDQSICPAGDPARIQNITPPSGGSGNWSYQWQSRVLPEDFTEIAGAIGLSYDPPAGLIETTEFQRVSTLECGVVQSNIVTVAVEDVENPVFTTCPEDMILEIERNEVTGQVDPPDPVVTDNCGVLLQTWTMSGATTGTSPLTGINNVGLYDFNLGVTTITYHVEDIVGNTAECSFYVTVEKKDPEVLNVTIPNNTMNIGDIISATITVGDDGDTYYLLVSGTVGGYPLTNLVRLNSTTYLANFAIIEGGNSYLAIENIPVASLVVSDGTVQSAPYNKAIVQNNDLLDAAPPVIQSMTVESGDKKIGDAVIMNIDADGPGYTIHPTSIINGILVNMPNIEFTDLGGGNYRLSYTVEDGDEDVGPGELKATIILVKPSGNFNLPYSNINNTGQLTIDAHPPVITRMEVPSEEVGVGGTVQVTITADGTGYMVGAGTTINGVPLGSPRVSYSERTGGLYELSYIVDSGDNNVAPGDLQVSLVMTDQAGNVSLPFSILQSNALEVYTELPTAVLAGSLEICEGESTELTVYFQGKGPWSFDLFNGATTTTFQDISTDNYKFSVTPEQSTTYSIASVRDRNDVENTGSGDITVTVFEKTFVQIINLASGYSVEADPVKLEANVPGGTFSGPGVISATGYFDPALADTVNSPHTITYTYVNANGCTSIASKLVFVLGAEGDIFIPSDIVCNNADPFTVNASNVAGANGSFRLLNANSQPVSGLTDNGDNTALIDPTLLETGEYTIEYAYFDEVILYLRKVFLIETVPVPVIMNLEDSYCQSVDPFRLQANVGNAVFEGPGVSYSIIGYMFNPRDVDPGEATISCTVTSVNGCSAHTQKSIQVLYAPEVQFALSTVCIPDSGGTVAFDNQTGGKLLVESWNWNFDDPESGENNQSNLIDPKHNYSEPGERSISLTATTFEGCASTYVMDTMIGTTPTVDFTWISDCFANGSGIKFINRSTSLYSPLDTLIWGFKTNTGGVLGEIGADPSSDTVAFPFLSVDKYRVELTAINALGCGDTASKEIVLRPTVKLTEEGYEEQFNESEAEWSIQSDDGVESWIWDVPDFTGFDQTPGDKGWFTSLPYEVGYMERSWIQSPCFDFSDIDRPVIKLDVMKSFVPNMNGAVLQYLDVNEEGWKTIGANTAGMNWYNVYNIYNKPGGSSIGWGLDVFNPDTDWVTAIHDLNELAGNPNVTFRIAIATSGAQGIGNQGFAFDNVIITERSKRAVIEHFTNSSDPTSRLADDVIDAFRNAHSKDVIDLQYHTGYPGIDPMNENNPNPPSTREFFYGIPSIPYAILDGGVQSYHRYDFSDLKTTPNGDHISLLSLEIPAFDIDLEVDWYQESLDATTTVICKADQYQDNVQLYLVVFESLVTAYTGANGDTEFRNVVLDMLPTPAGKLLGDNWYKNKSDTRTNSWLYAPYVEDVDDLGVAAFVQDRNTGKILQAAVNYKNPLAGVRSMPMEIETLHVYPNPANKSIFVNLGIRAEGNGMIELTDMSGRVVLTAHIPAGYQIYQLDIQHLNEGMYILHWVESGRIRGLSKIVKAR